MKYFFNIESKQNKTILNVLEIKLIFKKQVISYTYDLGDIIHSFFLFEEEGGGGRFYISQNKKIFRKFY